MNLFDLVATLGLDTSKFEKGISSAKSNLQSAFSNMGNNISNFGINLGNKLQQVGSNLQKVGATMSSLGATASVVTAGVTAVLGASFNKAKSFIQTYESAMTVFTRKLEGGKEAGIEMYNSLVQIAKGSAYAQEHMIEAGKVLVAMGVSADDTKKYVQAATDAISGFGGSGKDVEEMSQMFAKISQQTNMYTIDLNTMVRYGIPAWDILATKYGKTKDEVKKMAKEGLLPANESLRTITDALEETDSASNMFKYSVAGLAKELKSGTLTGTLDSLNTSFRTFSLVLWDLDPRTEEGTNNIKKLNATIAALGQTLENIGKKFSFVGKWAANALERVKEFLDNLNDKLESVPQEKLEKIAKVILAIAAAGPMLLITGKIISGVGGIFKLLGSTISGMSGSFATLAAACGGAGAALGVIAAVAVAVGAVVKVLKEHWDEVVNAFQQWAEDSGFSEKLKDLKKHFEELGKKVEKLNDYFQVLGVGILMSLVPAISLVMGVINGLMGAFDGLLTIIEGIIDFVAGASGVIIGIFTGDSQKIQQGLEDMGQGCLEIIRGIWETIWNTISGFCTGIWEFIKSVFNMSSINEWLSNTWNSISEWLSNTSASIEEWGQNLSNSITEWFSDVWDKITNWFSDVWNSIVEWGSNLWNNVQNFFTKIGQVVTVGFMLIGSVIDAAWQIITLPFMFIWENCKEYVFNVFNAISEFITNTWNSINEFLTPIIQGISDFITTTWDNIKNSITDTLNAISEFIINTWNSINEFLTPIIQGISDFIITTWDNIKNSITSALENIWNSAVSIWNSVSETTTTVWNNIKDSISNAINSAKDTVQNIFNNIKDSATNAWNDVKSTTSSVWENIKNSIKKPIQDAFDSVKNLIDRMKGLFNFSWNLPDIKLPHFSINGSFSLDPPSVPHLDIEWYKKGAVLNSPTIFGINPHTNNLMAGGEAGAEAVLPIKVLKSYIIEAMAEGLQEAKILYKNSANGKGTTAMVNGMISAINDNNQNINVYIGGKKIASEIYQPLMNLMQNKEVYFGA